ncbi:PKD domain-containing protein [Lewinella sp. LCG006]|uniref:PKD domain-containing protein n=1 Tax=Lewinella sp. LCG006 TaxID=3231911 RepID=UPI003461351F
MKYLLLIAVLLGHFFLPGQTSLSGQINVYSQLISQDDCTNTLVLNDASNFVPGMGLIIHQMNGANIDLNNADSYGDITDYNGSGQYEYNSISSISGNEVTLEYTLIHQYSGNATQVIGFQIYENASVDNTLSPAPWNGTTGGILALEVNGTLTLNADIDASGHGFRGGAPISITDNNCNFLTNADDFAYAANNWRGAPKGEGIGAANSSEPFGRGAQANGGGGGNDHNSGGGGGSLLTAGGQGGRNDEPSTFGCDGDFPGRPGKVLLTDNTLVFAGGGGGSGHANNNTASGGGNGGGIIFIKADAINFAGGSILNDGYNATNLSGDGGGGGGAGGSVLLIANTVSGTVQIAARGGSGATVNNGNNDRCFGPGGGGSGGILRSNIPLMADLTGGTAGLSINSTSCGEGTNNAENGDNGTSEILMNLVKGDLFTLPNLALLSNDTTVCEGTLITLIAMSSGSNYQLQWQRLVAGEWSDLVEAPGIITGTQTDSLQIQGNAALAGSYRLVLLPQEDCFESLNSLPVEVNILPPPSANPAYSANGYDVFFSSNTENGNSWVWNFLPGQSSTEENPNFTFPGPGDYPVTLSVTNECGTENYDLQVSLIEPLVVEISSNITEGCAPLVIAFEDLSSGSVENRIWNFPGGEPATSTAIAPLVTFPAPGTYTISLSISNSNNSASGMQEITVASPPVPVFNIITNDLTISLQNNSLNASSYFWNFGDGNTSTLENPVHTYASAGVYEVSLNASNDYCGVANAQTINVTISAIEDPADSPLMIYPNPTSGWLQIEHWTKGEISLIAPRGRLLTTWRTVTSSLDISAFPAGLYFLRYSDGDHQYWLSVVKQ